MKRIKTRNEDGVGLIIAVIFLVVMGLFATAAMSRVANHTQHVALHKQHKDTYLAMMSGYDEGTRHTSDDVAVPAGFDFTLGAGETMNGKMTQAMDAFFAVNPNPQLDSNRNVQYSVYNEPLNLPGGDFAQTATYAMGRYVLNGTPSTTRMVMDITRYDVTGAPENGDSIWEVAIFGGAGQGGQTINGNVSIHGSIHILGSDLSVGDIVLELAGGSGVYNNYDGMPPELEDNLSTGPGLLPNGLRLDENGEETIDSLLRVKNGTVSIDGAALIGQEVGDSELGTPNSRALMTGVFANNNWAGNQVTNGIPNDGTVNSANGFNKGYGDYANNENRGYPLFMEVINEATGQRYFNPNAAADGEPESYYLEGQTPYVGTITLKPNDDSTNFYYNSTTGGGTGTVGVPVGTTSGGDYMPTRVEVDAAIAADDFVIWFDADNELLVINGRIAVDGDIEIVAGNGFSNRTVNYEGQGTMLAYDGGSGGGEVFLSTNLYTTDFPLGNQLGLMAEVDLAIGGNANLKFLGGFYAQETISMNKQTKFAGTIVGNFYDLGGQVPSIYQVPLLEAAWTALGRMIGGPSEFIICPDCGENSGLVWFETGVLL